MKHYPELDNLDDLDERLRRAVLNIRATTGMEGLPRFDAATYERALQFARDLVKESRERRAEAIGWKETE